MAWGEMIRDTCLRETEILISWEVSWDRISSCNSSLDGSICLLIRLLPGSCKICYTRSLWLLVKLLIGSCNSGKEGSLRQLIKLILGSCNSSMDGFPWLLINTHRQLQQQHGGQSMAAE